MRSVRSAAVVALLLAVGLRLSLGTTVVVRCALLALPLLSSLELPIVDGDSVVHIGVKRLSVTVGLDKLVLDVVLKSIVESSLKRVRSLVNPEGKLSESRGILDSRLGLAEVIEILLRPGSLVVHSKDFDKCVLEVGKGCEDGVSLGAPFGQAPLQELPLGGFEPLQGPSLEVGGCKQHLFVLGDELVRVELEVGAKLGDESLQLLPSGPVEARRSADLGGPAGWSSLPRSTACFYVVQALLDDLECSKLRL